MENWIMVVELEFPVEDEDTKEKHVGDAEVDFANRAVGRFRPALDELVKNSKLAHYHIIPLKGGKMVRRN